MEINDDQLKKFLFSVFAQIKDVKFILNKFHNELNSPNKQTELFVKIFSTEKINLEQYTQIIQIVHRFQTLVSLNNIILSHQGKRYRFDGNKIIPDDIISSLSIENSNSQHGISSSLAESNQINYYDENQIFDEEFAEGFSEEIDIGDWLQREYEPTEKGYYDENHSQGGGKS